MPEQLLMALRAGRPEHTPESEPVVVKHDGNVLVLELDDGESIILDRAELHAASAPEGLAEAA